jgi:hypothetical protein
MWSRCQRQYYFHQIVASPAAKDPLRQRAQILNQITQPAWWAGKIVHVAIEKWVVPELRLGRFPSAEDVIGQAHRIAKQQYDFSESGKYHAIGKPEAGDAYCILAPHFFKDILVPGYLEETLTVIATVLRHLLDSQQMKPFLLGRQWYRWEQNLSFNVDGTTVRAIPDLVMPSKNDSGLDIVDWKVATSSSRYHFQVAVYALAARETTWLAAHTQSSVTGYVINLLEPEPAIALKSPYIIDTSVLAATENEIYESIERIRSLIQDRKYGQIDVSSFEYARSVGTCALCNWHELCMELSDESPAKHLSHHQPRPTQLELPFA